LTTSGGQTVSISGGNGTTGDTFNVTNSNSGASAATTNGLVLGLIGTGTSGGANTNNALNFAAVTAATNNTFNGLFFPASNNYTNYISTPTIAITGGGAITGATGLTSSGAITLSGLSTDKGIVYANGTGGLLAQTSQGAANTVLHGNGSSAPSFSAVALGTDVSGQLPLANGGTNANLTAVAGGIVYSGSSALAFSSAGTSGQCLVSGGTGTPTWGTCGGSSSWSALTDPSTNLSLNMGANTSTFTWNAATGSNTLLKLTDTASNTGNGYLLSAETATSSNEKPIKVVSRGNAIIDTTAAGGLVLGNTTAAQDITIDSGTGTLNLGSGTGAKTINIGTGISGNIINIGTNNTNADTINIGSALDTIKIGKFSTANGLVYISATDGTVAQTAASTGIQCLQTSSAGSAPTWGACGSGVTWNSIGNPSGNLGLSMGANTTTFTFNSATGNNNLFTFIDTANNSGTGYIIDLETASGSTAKPLKVVARGSNTIIDTTAVGDLTLGTSGQTVTIASPLTLNGDTTIAANKSLTLTSGTGIITQTFSNSSASSANVKNITNANTGLTATTVNGLSLSLTNSTNTNSTNTLNGINFNAASNNNANVINGINFASTTGFSNFLNTPSLTISSAGAIAGATGLSSSGTVTFSGLNTAGAVVYTDGSGVLGKTTQGTTNQCLLSGGSGVPTWGSCASGSSSAVWSSLTAPTANLTLNHGTNTTAFNWSTSAGSAAFDGLTLAVNNNGVSSGSQRGLVVRNNNIASGGTTNSLLLIDNASTAQTLTKGLQITSSGGGSITDAIDVSGSNITNAVNLGANQIVGTTAGINFSSYFQLTNNPTPFMKFTGDATYTGSAKITLSSGGSSNLVLKSANATGLTIDSTNTTLNATGLNTLISATSLSLNPTTGSSYTLDTSATTLTAFGTPTTLTFGGAATTVSIGASTGTATINNATTQLAGNLTFTGSSARTITGPNTGATGALTVTTAGNVSGLNLNTANGSSGNSGAISLATGTVTTSGTSGAVTINSGASNTSALNTGAITVQSGNITTSGTSGDVTVDVGTGGTAGALNLGTSAIAKTVNIGATSGTTAQTIKIGEGAAGSANAITIGNTQNAGSVAVGTAMTTGTVTIGGTSETGAVTVNTGNQTGAGGGIVLSATSVSTGVGLQISGGSSLGNGGKLVNISGASYNLSGSGDSGSVSNLSFSNVSSNSSGPTTVSGLTITPTYNVSGAGTHTVADINLAGVVTNTCGAGTCNKYGLYFSGTGYSQELFLQNGETIDNATNGTVNLAANSGALTLNLTGTAANITNSAGALGITGTTALNLTATNGNSTWKTTAGTLTIQSGDTSASALSMNTAANGSGATGKIAINTGNATSGNSGAIDVITGTTTTSGTTGALTLQSGAPVTASLNSGNVTLSSGNVGSSGTSGIVSVDVGTGGTAGALNIGTSAVAKTITIGTTGAVADVINMLNTTTAGTVDIGKGVANHTIRLGNNQTGGTISVGTAMTTGTVTIGGTSETGAVTVNTGNQTGAGGGIVLSATSVSTGVGLQISGGSSLGNGGKLVNISGASYNLSGSGDSGSVSNLSFSNVSSNSSGPTTVSGLTITPTYNVSGAGTHTVADINLAGVVTNTCGAGTCNKYGLYFSGTGYSQELFLQNGETIDNATNGSVNLSTDTGALTLELTAGASTSTTIHTNQTTANLLNTTTTSINFGGAATAMGLGASGGLTITPGGNLTFTESATKAITISSTLGAARSADVLTISQPNDAAASNDSTGALMVLNNADTGSSGTTLKIVEAGSGNALTVSDGTNVNTTLTKSGVLTLGKASTTTGQLTFTSSANSGTTTFQAGNQAGVSQTYTWPTTGLTSSAVFLRNNNGTLVWDTSTATLGTLAAASQANTINNSDFAQVWNWALTNNNKSAFIFGENTAAINGTAGNQYILKVSTLASSTAAPLTVIAQGNTIIDTTNTGGITIGNATAAQPITIDAGTANLNIGNSANARTINLGTGGAVQTIHIGDSTQANVLTIGSTTGAATDNLNFGTGGLNITNGAATTGTPTGLVFTRAAHNGISNAEATDINLDLGTNTVTFTGGASTSFATQRAMRLQAPTYAATTATLTITNASTMNISGAPIIGTNVAMTNAYGLKIDSNAVGTATNAYGLHATAPTGATNKYAIWSAGIFGGQLGICKRTSDADVTNTNWTALTSGNCNNTFTNAGAGATQNMAFDVEFDNSGGGAASAKQLEVNINTSAAEAGGVSNVNDGTLFYYTTKAVRSATTGDTTVKINAPDNTNNIVTTVTTATNTTIYKSGVAMRVAGTWRNITGQSTNANGGADLAEWVKFSGQKPVAGELLSAAPGPQTVKRSTLAYDRGLVGIMTTAPHTLMGQQNEDATPMALAGRVPVIVTSFNGNLKNGDPITSSWFDGVGMRANKSGIMVGKAVESTSDWNDNKCSSVESYDKIVWPADDGTNPAKPCFKVPTANGHSMYVGKIVTMVGYSYTEGDMDVLTGGITADQQSIAFDASEVMLSKLMETNKVLSDNGIKESKMSLSQFFNDRIAAGLEIITPKVTTQKLLVDTIQPATGKDVALQLSPDGKFVVKDENANQVIAFDSRGNATFKGTVTADKIKANQIEGLEYLVAKATEAATASVSAIPTAVIPSSVPQNDSNAVDVNKLLAKSDPALVQKLESNGSTNSQPAVLGAQTQQNTDLAAFTKATSDGSLSIDRPVDFKNKSLFSAIVEFLSNVIFHGDVTFLGRPTFNSDTAGIAVVKKGSREVEVVFDKEYTEKPIVTASISLDNADKTLDEAVLAGDIKYILTKRSTKGFVIKLAKEAGVDMPFSWTALAVSGAKTVESVTGTPTSNASGANITGSNTPTPSVTEKPKSEDQQKAANSISPTLSPTVTVNAPATASNSAISTPTQTQTSQ